MSDLKAKWDQMCILPSLEEDNDAEEMKRRAVKVYHTSKSDEWSTPQEIFDDLNEEFRFDLDPCSTDENYKCEKHFTIWEDGLKQNWGGIEYFVTHLIAKSQSGLRSATEKVARITR